MRYCINQRLRSALVKILKLSGWQETPLADKEYAYCTLAMIQALLKKNNYQNGSIVEIGCGLGDIIGSIDAAGIMKKGIDINYRNVIAARLLYFFKRKICFVHGGLENANLDADIHMLIMVNFLHNIHPCEVKRDMQRILDSSRIDYIIIDEMRGDILQYKYEQNGEELLGEFGYKKQYVSRRLKAAGNAYRTINVYRYIMHEDYR